MKRIILVITALAALILAASCGGGYVVYDSPPPSAPAAGKSWTVLVYMCGGSEETNNAAYSKKLESLMSLGYPENIHVIIETGGSSEWHTKGIYNDYTQRFEVGNGTLYLADQTLSANMGEYNTLADFISWGMSNYKSDKYALVLAGSGGGGLGGLCGDQQFENDCLTLGELSYAMSSASKGFDLVLMDAPLMGTLETASLLSTYTEYLVAPQDLICTDDIDYAALVNAVISNPSADGKEIGKAVCDSYYNNLLKQKREQQAAMSVIDISEISTLNQAFDGFAGNMCVATDSFESYLQLEDALSHTHAYGGLTPDEGYSNLIDLGDAAVRSAEVTGASADMLIEELNNAVAYRVCGSEQSNCSGMSFYYPINKDNDTLQQYMDMSLSVRYREFLRKICINCSVTDAVTNTPDYTASWAWETYRNDMEWLEYNSILDGSTYELDVAGNMALFKDVTMNVYKKDENSGKYYFAGNYNKLNADWESGIFRDNFDGTLPAFLTKNVSIRKARSYDDYDLYSIPVSMNGIRKYVRAKYYGSEDKFEIIGMWNGLDEKKQTTGAFEEIKSFDRLTPVLSVYDSEHGAAEYMLGTPNLKLWNGLDYKKLDDGDYILEYELTDVYGLKRRGTPVECRISGGQINF